MFIFLANSAIKISIVGMVTFVFNLIANGVFRAMFYSTASRHNRRPVNPFVPNIKMIAEFVYLGELTCYYYYLQYLF